MKTDIILAGVGGQGILTIAATVASAALHSNAYIKQAEVHGMSQRGGAVQSHLRVSDKEISSDLIPLASADLILAVEPMESLRYLPYLSKDGWLISNETPFENISNYPVLDSIHAEIKKVEKHVLLGADEMAKKIGPVRSSNMVMLGAASPFVHLPVDSIEQGIRSIFSGKGEDVVRLNLEAFHAGRDFALEKARRE
jgi:indolepyruvate ferredoxin oxidoreductase beta subunit